MFSKKKCVAYSECRFYKKTALRTIFSFLLLGTLNVLLPSGMSVNIVYNWCIMLMAEQGERIKFLFPSPTGKLLPKAVISIMGKKYQRVTFQVRSTRLHRLITLRNIFINSANS